MNHDPRIVGRAAAIRIDNLDTDQIMPKQFLRGIDKKGLADGVLHDLRFAPDGAPRAGFVLNRPADRPVRVLLGGANFGCGSSREHAVWGLLQFGIEAVVAPSFGEIFHANAMQNGLLLVMLPRTDVEALMADADAQPDADVRIDVAALRIASAQVDVAFELGERQRRKFLEGTDDIGLTLARKHAIDAFAAAHWARQPWLRDVAAITRRRLDAKS